MVSTEENRANESQPGTKRFAGRANCSVPAIKPMDASARSDTRNTNWESAFGKCRGHAEDSPFQAKDSPFQTVSVSFHDVTSPFQAEDSSFQTDYSPFQKETSPFHGVFVRFSA